MGLSYGTNLDISKNYEAANTSYLNTFDDLFKAEPTAISSAYAKKVPTSGTTMRIDALGPTPVMAKWLGPRPEDYLRSYYFSMTLEKYVATIWFDRHDIQYDNSGAIGKRMGDFLMGSNFYDKFAIAELIANRTCYDGTALMNTSHPHAISGGTWSNYDTNALNRLNVQTAEEAAMDVTLENGEPANIGFDTVIVGPKNKNAARRIWQADERVAAIDGQGKETSFAGNPRTLQNIYKGELTVVVDKRIRGATNQYYWFMVDSTKPYGAVIIMEGMAPRPSQRQNPEDPRVWDSDQFGWGILSDVAFGPGAPQTVSGHKATTGGW